jgi:hypothetical protein
MLNTSYEVVNLKIKFEFVYTFNFELLNFLKHVQCHLCQQNSSNQRNLLLTVTSPELSTRNW